MAPRTLHVVSPHMHGNDVKDAQYLLTFNRFDQSFHPGAIDGVYGITSGKAAQRARYYLGFSDRAVRNTEHPYAFGPQLRAYLLGPRREGGARLPAAYVARRDKRMAALRETHSIKALALDVALKQVGIHESPWGSNDVKFSYWYGLPGEPWCAQFVTFCFVTAGDVRIFARGSRTAWAYWPEEQARQGHPLLHITHDPQPGDIAVYHHGQGHIGIFKRWLNQSQGLFEAVEGNTSNGGSQDNGGAVLVQRRYTSWAPTVFVAVGE